MIWQNPWAFAGLAALALPVLIHLLSRKQASLQQFPTLRFLDVSRLLPTRSPRITDVLLLIVRLGIITSAVLALAGPLFASATRTRSANAKIARAIIVETDGESVGSTQRSDSSLLRAQQLASDASASTIIPTTRVAGELEGAEAWLRLQRERSELVILSDFRESSIDSVTLATVPKEFGLKLERASPQTVSGDSAVGVFQSQQASVRVTAEPVRTLGEWTSLATPSNADDASFSLHTAARDNGAVEAIRNTVAQSIGALKPDSAHPIALVYPNASDYSQLVAAAKPMKEAWMAALVSKLRVNAHFNSALARSAVASDTTLGSPFSTLGRNAASKAVVYAAQIAQNGHDILAIFVRAEPSTVTSAELIAAIAQTESEEWSTGALEPSQLSDATLAALQRDASVPKFNSAAGPDYLNAADSDARWFWIVALALLGVEAWLRIRQERMSPNVEISA